MDMVKNLSTRSAKSQCAYLQTIMTLLQHASTSNRKKALRQLKVLRTGQKNVTDLRSGSPKVRTQIPEAAPSQELNQIKSKNVFESELVSEVAEI